MGAFAPNNQVEMYPKPPKPLGFSDQQTNAAYNFQRAQADSAADPRMNMKAFDRAGFSRGKGQQGYAAAAAANAYSDQMAQAQQIPLQDASSNANLGLQYAASQDQMGLALARLQEQAAQQQAMANMQAQANASGFAGGMFRNLTGGGLLSGLLG